MKKQIKIYLIIIFLSISCSLYLFEAYLIFFKTPGFNFLRSLEYKYKTGKTFDTRSKIDIYKELKKDDQNITVNASPSNLLNKENIDIYRLSGKSNAKTIYCNENGYYSIYQSDRYGFNNPDEEWNKDLIEYVIIGDSFAHGACVNRPFDISSRLRDLTKKSVLNLGYGGNGPLIEYATLREYYPNKVNKLIWLYYEGNDNYDLENELKNKFLKRYFYNQNYSQNLRNYQLKINKLVDELVLEYQSKNKKTQIMYNKIISFIKLYKLRSSFLIKNQNKEIDIYGEFEKLTLLIKKFAELNNSELYFVYLPDIQRYKNNNYNNDNYLVIKKLIEDLEIEFIDIHKEVFMTQKKPLKLFPFRIYRHYTVDGYNKIAYKIYQYTK